MWKRCTGLRLRRPCSAGRKRRSRNSGPRWSGAGDIPGGRVTTGTCAPWRATLATSRCWNWEQSAPTSDAMAPLAAVCCEREHVHIELDGSQLLVGRTYLFEEFLPARVGVQIIEQPHEAPFAPAGRAADGKILFQPFESR